MTWTLLRSRANGAGRHQIMAIPNGLSAVMISYYKGKEVRTMRSSSSPVPSTSSSMSLQIRSPQDFKEIPIHQGKTITEAAKYDLRRYGKDIAAYLEWQRFLFQPAFKNLKDHIEGPVDPDRPREVLVLSQNWCTFERIANAVLKLPEDMRRDLKQWTLRLLDMVGQYWVDYHFVLEKDTWDYEWSKSHFLLACDPRRQNGMHDRLTGWFRTLRVDEDASHRTFLADRDERYWQIFRAGVARHRSPEGRKVLAQFREIPEWNARFLLMERCFDADIGTFPPMRDPVTIGGAAARRTLRKWHIVSDNERAQSLTVNIFHIIDDVCTTLEMEDSCAEQAISVFAELLETSPAPDATANRPTRRVRNGGTPRRK